VTETVQKALFYHYLLAGLGLVLLAVVWALGWVVAPEGLYEGKERATQLLIVTALVQASWNLLSCVVAAGFFHAASVNAAKTFRSYQSASLRLLFLGIVFVFPVPFMTNVLGAEVPGRILALFVVVISMAGIMFGRARIRMIGRRLAELEDSENALPLAPFETPPTESSEL